MDPRTAVAFVALALLGGGLWWIAGHAPGPGDSGTFTVYVVAPDGSLLANGSVTVDQATALSLLLRLAAEGNFTVDVESASGFSKCSTAYVNGIGPHVETATGGWNYYTRADGGAWELPQFGAGCGLPRGVEVEWCWVEHDVCSHHVP